MKLIKLPLKKEMSLGTFALKRAQPQERLRVPVYTDAPFYQIPRVVPGQLVSGGMKIAEPRSSLGIPVFSPANGVVTEIVRARAASGESILAIEIQVDKKNIFSFLPAPENSDWMDATTGRLLSQIREAGIVLNGRAPMPLVSFLEKGSFHNKTLVVNACESEPYVTSAQVLMLAHSLEILKGAEILCRAAGVKEIVIAISEDAEQAAELLRSKIYFLKWGHVRVQVFPSRYPQDAPSVLMRALYPELNRLSPHDLEAWPLPDIASIWAAYEAVVFGKPFFERVVTVTGECVVMPQNLTLPFGMTVTDALKACKGVLREPGRMIAGGPMRGRAASLEDPVSAQTEALVALPKENTADARTVDCIRCGECAEVCPSDLAPALIAIAEQAQNFERARHELDSKQCIACGNCAYVCPSHLPLVEMIQGGVS